MTLREFGGLAAPGAQGRLGARPAQDPEQRAAGGPLGGAASVDRLQSFQRQRAARLAQRMHNFGYDAAAMVMVCRTLFLTRLHNKDLWGLWRFFSRGRTETPLTLTQTRHLLALLSDESPQRLDTLVTRVDADGSGSVEFDESPCSSVPFAAGAAASRHRLPPPPQPFPAPSLRRTFGPPTLSRSPSSHPLGSRHSRCRGSARCSSCTRLPSRQSAKRGAPPSSLMCSRGSGARRQERRRAAAAAVGWLPPTLRLLRG